MALYLGNSGGQKVILGGHFYCLNAFFKDIIINDTMLLSADGCILTDANGMRLTIKDGE